MEVESKKHVDQKDVQPISFLKLFAFADSIDAALMAFGSIGAIVHGIAMPVYFHLLSGFLDMFGGKGASASQIAHNCLYLIYLGLIVWAGAWIEVLCWTYTGERQTLRIRTKYLEGVLRQDIEIFDTSLRTGEVIESISSDMLLLQNAIGEKMGNAIHFFACFVAGMILGFATVWQISLVTIAVVPVIAATAALQGYMITNISSKSQEAYGKAGIIAEQAIAQVRTVYSFVGEAKTLQSYSIALANAREMAYKIGFFNGLGLGTLFMSTYGVFSFLVWFGSVAYFRGYSSGGEILVTMFFVILGGIALGQASLSFSAFGQARAAAAKIFPVITKFSELDNSKWKGKQMKMIALQGEIIFKRVDFAYPSRPDVPILNKFSLVIPKGKSFAIVGSSGSGKSTLVALIERFYEPSSGSILLDGHDIKSIELKWLRLQLGLVSQEPVLFATTIKDNILLGKEDATLEEVEDAAKFAHVHAFIEKLPNGYNTQVGDKGVQLSGGQKQRIALARAVLRNPPILLLDEATSALDSSSEKLIQEALDQFMTLRTAIVIAHRLSTIQHVDTIVVLEKGKLVERGTHMELMSKGESGAYFKLVKLQEINRLERSESMKSVERSSYSSTPWFTPKSTPRRSVLSPYLSPSLGTLGLNAQLSYSMSIDVEIEGREAISGIKSEEIPLDTGYFWRLVKLNAPEWPYALLGSIGCVLTGAVSPFLALLLAAMATLFYNTDYHHVRLQVRLYAIYFALLAGVGMVGFLIQEYFWGRVNENLLKRIREGMLSAILRSEIAWFDRDENSSSQLSTRLSLEAATVRTVLGGRVSLIVNNSTTLVVACVICFVLSWKLTLVNLCAFPLAVVAAIAEKAFLKGYTGDIEAAQRKASTIAAEGVASIRTVAAFCAEEKIVSLFTRELSGTKRQSLWTAQVSGFTFGSARFLQFGSYCLSLWYGIRLASRHEADPNDAVKVFFVMLMGAMVVGDAIGIVPDLVKGGSALKSVFAILDRQAQIDPEDKTGASLEKVSGHIELRKVDFSYPTRAETTILKNFSLKVAAGKSMALVGPSGCGKSTIVALIERFYDPLGGKVMIDGVDIRNYNLRSLRRHIGLVQQEPALFATSIYDNILYGNMEATEAEVQAAAKVANAHDFISGLPDGYETFVGERGVQLSGGQKQRVAIARAVLKNPAILLLDEATSALDTESEKVVQEALERLMKGRSVVAIAHRLSTIVNMDAIAVLQNGAVVEQGTHSDLLSRRSGVYSGLVALQDQRT